MTRPAIKQGLRWLAFGKEELICGFRRSQWQELSLFCVAHQLETLLAYRVSHLQDQSELGLWKQRLENLYTLYFAYWARLKKEVDIFKSKGIEKPYFLIKGFPLAEDFYPTPVCRKMVDIDIFFSNDNFNYFKDIFDSMGYLCLPDQSKLEKKNNFVKIWGSYVFAFEFHRYLYTPYLKSIPNSSFNDPKFCQQSSKSALIISILLHHRYYETHVRDLFDCFFLFKKQKFNDQEKSEIIEFVDRNQLRRQVKKIGKAYSYFFNEPFELEPCLNHSSVEGPLYYLKWTLSVYSRKKRNIVHKFCDAVFCVFVYDHIWIGLKCFWNKYFRFVSWRKYFRLF